MGWEWALKIGLALFWYNLEHEHHFCYFYKSNTAGIISIALDFFFVFFCFVLFFAGNITRVITFRSLRLIIFQIRSMG